MAHMFEGYPKQQMKEDIKKEMKSINFYIPDLENVKRTVKISKKVYRVEFLDGTSEIWRWTKDLGFQKSVLKGKIEKVEKLAKQNNIHFRVCESGLFCLGGITVAPKYYKSLDSVLKRLKKEIIEAADNEADRTMTIGRD